MKYPFAVFTIGLCALSPLSLFAQDVTIGDPIWALNNEPAPDEMPKRAMPRPDFPDEMLKSSEIGYVMVTRFVDATSKTRTIGVVGTQVIYERVVHSALLGNELSPARRAGKPVDTRLWIPVIFNPKSASLKGPDTTPRLLAAAPVFTHDRPAPSGQPPVVRMRLSLDATGAITAVEPEGGIEVKDRLLDDVRDGLGAWRFAPARKGGQPVAAEIAMAVICQAAPKADAGKFVPAHAISREPPLYPMAMRRFGIGGQVLFEFEIDADGKLLNPVVRESDNPEFDQPALDALFQWKFAPATRDGKPVKSKMGLTIVFTPNNGSNDNGIFQVSGAADQTKLPPELRFDTPAKFRGVMLPFYPLEAREAGVRGKANVAIFINPQGRVFKVNVMSADRPEFGLALTAAAEGFRFEPAYRDGKPVPHVLKFEQPFNEDALDDVEGGRLFTLEKKHPERIFSADKLDAVPTPRSRRTPVFPLNVEKGVIRGDATVEFLIDTEGHARLPRVVSASDPAFGYAAMQAVNTWLFSRPTVNGKAVVTRVQVPLQFEPPKPKLSAKPAASVPEAAPTPAADNPAADPR